MRKSAAAGHSIRLLSIKEGGGEARGGFGGWLDDEMRIWEGGLEEVGEGA